MTLAVIVRHPLVGHDRAADLVVAVCRAADVAEDPGDIGGRFRRSSSRLRTWC